MRIHFILFFTAISLWALAGCNKEGNDTDDTTDMGGVTTTTDDANTADAVETTEDNGAAAPQTVVETPADVTAAASSARVVNIIPVVFQVATSASVVDEKKPEPAQVQRESTVDAAYAAALTDSAETPQPQTQAAPQVAPAIESEKAVVSETHPDAAQTVQYADPLNRIATVDSSDQSGWTESPRKSRSKKKDNPDTIVVNEVVSRDSSSHETRTRTYTVYRTESTTQCFTGG